MKLYRCMHKVEAARWNDTDEERERFADWFDLQGIIFETRGPIVVLPEDCGRVQPGEWIVFSDGEFIAMDDEQFRNTYAEVAS